MSVAWKFPDAPNTACFTTTEVLNGAPIVLVSHDYEGDWQFHAASTETMLSSVKIVCLADMIRRDDLLAELHGLPLGWGARWDDWAGHWERFKDKPFLAFAEQGYYLEDAVWLSRYLTDIEPPPAAVRDALPIGACVKRVFRFAAEDGARGDGQCERMWVQVTGIDEYEAATAAPSRTIRSMRWPAMATCSRSTPCMWRILLVNKIERTRHAQ
ncbi:hypothetical protein OX462_11290 [Janthinobacterium sp. SUN098]|uniref:hypothetical protein n=1 Tax=Janthinobacterium sp. SUN098 TaxID=3002437 RepID=UPI0038D43B0E